MQTIRKSIYIGLGGTGVKAIAETKKMFEETFGLGNIPPQVTFLALDYDRSIVNDCGLATDISADFVQLPLSINPFLLHQAQQQTFGWMPEKNKLFIPEFMECGAGQVRTNARLFATLVLPCIEAAVNGAMARVLSLANQQRGYLVMDDDHVNVYLAMSFAGGTGSSLMLTVANMVRERYDHANIIGYGIMHSIFHLVDPYSIVTPRIRSNTYASLLELDYFQSATFEAPVRYDFFGTDKSVNEPLFDEFYVVDNKTQLGGVVDSLQSLCNAVGCSMFYGGTDVGKVHAIDWKKRGLNWGRKPSWVHSFGICQIVYNGAEMADLYCKRVAADLIDYMVGKSKAERRDVHEWAERVSLREDGDDYNKLIDRICSPDLIARLRQPFLDSDFSCEEIKSYLSTYSEKNATLWTKDSVAGIIADAVAALRDEVRRLLGQKSGVSLALSFLSMLEEILAGYKMEMADEIREFKESSESMNRKLKAKLTEYDEYQRSFFSRLFGKHRRALAEVSMTAAKISRSGLEIARRSDAITVFVTLINEVKSQVDAVTAVSDMMLSLAKRYRTEIHQKELEVKKRSLFEIDLSHKDAAALTLEMNENCLVEFTGLVDKSLTEMEAEDLEKVLMKFTENLPAVSRFRNRLIMDIIQEMSDDEYEELKQNIIRKSSPLLSLQDRGLIRMESNGGVSPISSMMKVFYISAFKEKVDQVTRFEGDDKLLAGDNVRVAFVPSDSASMKQRVYIHRVDSAIMPYCIEALDESMLGDTKRYSPYFGEDFRKCLVSSGFTMKPEI
jgi:hypothetical protein